MGVGREGDNRRSMPQTAAYCQHIEATNLATFEEVPPSTEEMSARRASAISSGLPYLVVEYSYAAKFHSLDLGSPVARRPSPFPTPI
jgi:L-amino acid N-acyltransferase YncA